MYNKINEKYGKSKHDKVYDYNQNIGEKTVEIPIENHPENDFFDKQLTHLIDSNLKNLTQIQQAD